MQVNGGISTLATGQQNGPVTLPIMSAVTTDQTTAGGAPKKVYKIKTAFEGRTEQKTFGQNNNVPPPTNSHIPLSITTDTEQRKESNVRMVPAPVAPPPMQFNDTAMESPRMVTAAPPPPPPPPPPPLIPTVSDGSGTFTFRDKKGRARTVRIGKVVWPPPANDEQKEQREVGRLEIDENVKQNIDNRLTGKKQWKKPEVTEEKKVRKLMFLIYHIV